MSIVIVIGLSVFFKVFDRFDRWVYDEAILSTQFITSQPPQVLLVEVEAGYDGLSVNDWFNLLEQIQQFKPAAIGINLLPWNWSEKDLIKVSKTFSPVIGSPHPDSYSRYQNVVYSAVPPLDGKVYRQQSQQQFINGKNYPVLESEVARIVTQTKLSNSENYYINFIGGQNRLPVVSSHRVLDGGLIEALVKDKVVLIGVEVPLMMELPSPLGMMSYASYQAYALDTLLNQNSIKIAGIWQVLTLVVLMVLVILLAVIKIPERYQLIFISTFIFVTLLSSYISLLWFQYWLMPGYLLIAEFFILLSLLFLRNRQNQLALQGMALSSAARIETHWLSENFYSSDVHWNHIANMVTQTLSLERTIFLEKVENDHRVREIKALNCSLDDISEMRRDYQRTPYTTAIEYAGALKLDHKYFEASGADDEVQYLVPLSFAGNIQGFWAFTIKQNIELDEEKLIDAIEQFAMQISELLYHRAEWEKNQQEQQNFIVKMLQMKFEESSYDSINHSINFLTHRLSIMETLMDGLESLAILYDLFGRVVHVNKSMTRMLTDINLIPYSMTAVDLIVSLTGCSMTEARNYLSYLILEQGSINIPVKKEGVKTGYMMMIRALKSDEDHEDASGEIKPFEMIGILCELVDMSQIRELYSQKEKIVEYMNSWLRNDLSSISMACDLVQDARITDDKRETLMQLIKQKVTDLGHNFEQVNTIVQQDLISKVTSQYPVDYIESLKTVINECQSKQKKSIDIHPVIPFCSPLVMAAPKELRQVFNAILVVLISDALEESKIQVIINYDKNQMRFEFKNEGFGIPQEQLTAYLESDDTLDSSEFQDLKMAYQQITNWDGAFTAVSKIGEGMDFNFTLKAFQL
jgi:hypothetical protein